MRDVLSMLERQSAWQRARCALTWTEKLRMAIELREAAIAMRESGHRASSGAKKIPAERGRQSA